MDVERVDQEFVRPQGGLNAYLTRGLKDTHRKTSSCRAWGCASRRERGRKALEVISDSSLKRSMLLPWFTSFSYG
jgi:hypothetical protein